MLYAQNLEMWHFLNSWPLEFSTFPPLPSFIRIISALNFYTKIWTRNKLTIWYHIFNRDHQQWCLVSWIHLDSFIFLTKSNWGHWRFLNSTELAGRKYKHALPRGFTNNYWHPCNEKTQKIFCLFQTLERREAEQMIQEPLITTHKTVPSTSHSACSSFCSNSLPCFILAQFPCLVRLRLHSQIYKKTKRTCLDWCTQKT